MTEDEEKEADAFRVIDALRAERDMLTETLARVMAENEHLRRALWLAQHPAHTSTTHQEAV